MAVEFFQYQVDKRWYRLYWVIMLCFSLFLAGLYILFELTPSLKPYKSTFGLIPTLAVLIIANLAYLSLGFWRIARTSLPLATLIGAMLYILLLLCGLVVGHEDSGGWLYVAGWLPTIFFGGIYGLSLLLGPLFLTLIYVGERSSFQPSQLSKSSLLLLLSTFALSGLAYFFWKSRFVNLESQKIDRLSGMLQMGRQQSEILIESITDGILVIDTSGKITLINAAAAAMTQWSVKEAIGMDVTLVVTLHKEDGGELMKQQDPFTLVFSESRHTNQTLQLKGREGRTMIISLSISPVLLPGDQNARGAVAVIRDVSEEREAEKARGEFISTASHEMRTPVAAIEGYLALALNDKVSTVDSRARGFLEKAHSSTQHLGKLFQDLLTSSKAEDGRLSNHPSVVEMGAFMQQVTDDLKFSAEKKGLAAEFVIGGADEAIDATAKDASMQHLVKPLYYVFADPDRIREVITNLFDNACKYTDNGKVSVGLTGNNDVVQLYIRDTGAGIPPEDIPHLFQKFYRVDSSSTRTIGGTGLGLFICRKIVELYQGRIWVESEVGKGSTFFINLPRLTTARANELQNAEAAMPPAAPTPAPAPPASPAPVPPAATPTPAVATPTPPGPPPANS